MVEEFMKQISTHIFLKKIVSRSSKKELQQYLISELS